MMHSLWVGKSDFWTLTVVRMSLTPTSKFKMAALCINSSESCSDKLIICTFVLLVAHLSVQHVVVLFVCTKFCAMCCYQLVLLTCLTRQEQTPLPTACDIIIIGLPAMTFSRMQHQHQCVSFMFGDSLYFKEFNWWSKEQICKHTWKNVDETES